MAAPMENMKKIIPADLQQLLDKYNTFTIHEAREKICCDLSGHEMPCRLDVLESYVKGKKFIKLYEKQQYKYEKQHLVQSNKHGRSHQLFCLLTLRHINNTPKHIQRHLDGRRFKKALKRWEECQRTGEIFKPHRPSQKQDEFEMSSDNSNHGDQKEEDNLSDLYPDESGEEEEMEEDDSENERTHASTSQEDIGGSDYEFEDLESENKHEIENESPIQTTNVTSQKSQSAQKRKLKPKPKKQKKVKT